MLREAQEVYADRLHITAWQRRGAATLVALLVRRQERRSAYRVGVLATQAGKVGFHSCYHVKGVHEGSEACFC